MMDFEEGIVLMSRWFCVGISSGFLVIAVLSVLPALAIGVMGNVWLGVRAGLG